MNKFIKTQLNKVKSVILPRYDDTTTEIKITRDNYKAELVPQIGHDYLIEVQDYIINPPPGFSLSANWNNNTHPIEKQMNVEIIKTVGKMYYLHTIGVTTNSMWDGWLPEKSIEFIKEL